MTKVQEIIKEIKELSPEDLKKVLKEILNRVETLRSAEASIDKITGSGEGIWEQDAQKLIDEYRERDRA